MIRDDINDRDVLNNMLELAGYLAKRAEAEEDDDINEMTLEIKNLKMTFRVEAKED